MSEKLKSRRANIVKLWRKAGLPRLYWHSQHNYWRTWEKDDIAMYRDGSLRVHFTSYAALEDYLIENNAGEFPL